MGLSRINNSNSNSNNNHQEQQNMQNIWQSQLEEAITQLQTKDIIISQLQDQYNNILTIVRQQEAKLTEQNAQINSLNAENEKLLKLAENEKLLNNENEKLKKENSLLKKQAETDSNTITKLQDNLTHTTDSITKAINAMPDSRKLAEANRVLDTFIGYARDLYAEVGKFHWYNKVNWFCIALLVIALAGSAYNSYKANQSAQHTQMLIDKALYNADGWSVVQGSKSDIQHQQLQQYINENNGNQ